MNDMSKCKLSPFYKYGIIDKINQKWNMVDEYYDPYDERCIEAQSFTEGAKFVLARFGYQIVFEDERLPVKAVDIIPITF